MNKLIQMINVIGCWYELEKPDIKETGNRGVGAAFGSLIVKALWLLILAFGICMDWVRIPTDLGDGYGYDNFER